MTKPPFRADQVGSLLRPATLANARDRHRRGEISAVELRQVEDEAIRDVVRRQESIGLQAVVDGELRRDYWHIDFLRQLDGVTVLAPSGPRFHGSDEQPPIATVTGRVGCSTPIMADDFAFLRSVTSRVPKYTIPSPSMLHLRGGRNGISRAVYPELDEFWIDAAGAYRRAIHHLADRGCTYLQLDDVSFAYLCDPKIRDACRANGDDPDALPAAYARAINLALSDRPPGMTISMHTCRGNFKSSFVASGGYDPIVEAMFSIDVDAFFMEFDSDRAGGFEPLRLLPAGRKVVLGLVTTKHGSIEDADTLKRRIDEAARHVPLENLCLSPQCGFASTHHGNAVSEAEQWRKLELIVSVAGQVWGGH
jgi:5-methyltetrahydropteroyltriglutamate--homocysteine methyltransferase